jgi:hypothetical protein
VSQISPPIRILLAVAVVFMAAYMTVLKPKTEEIGPEPTGTVATGDPAVSSPGKVAEAAKGAADATNAHTDAVDAATAGAAATATGTQSGTSQPGATVAKAGEITGVPTPIARALEKRKIVAILFENRKAADDRAVRAAFNKADRWNGRVHFARAPIARVARYSPITRGVDVNQSPTIVIVDRDRNATPLVGYVDTPSIDQAVVDALRNSGALFTSAYLRKVNDTCTSTSNSIFAIPSAQSIGEAPGTAKRHAARMRGFAADLRAIPAPARYRAFKRATVADATAMSAALGTWSASISRNGGVSNIVTASVAAERQLAGPVKRFNARMDANHVLSCGTNG